MKKALFVLAIFVVFTAGNLPAQEINLKEAIVHSARGVEDALPNGTMVAILNFSSPSETFSNYVIDELTGELVTGQKVTIVDRQNLALIRQEMNLQLSGDVSDESAQAIGKMLGAQSIISGSLTDMRTFHRFRIRVISVETARIQTQVSLDLRNDEQVAYLLSGNVENATASTRKKPKTDSNYHLFGFYFDASVLGGFSWSAGMGVSFFNDIVRLQAHVANAPSDGGHTGWAFGGKLFFSVYPIKRNFYSAGIALGGQLANFFMAEDEDSVIMGSIFCQLEFIRADMSYFFPEWKYFKSFSLYAEPQLWFPPPDVRGEAPAILRISFGLRISLF